MVKVALIVALGALSGCALVMPADESGECPNSLPDLCADENANGTEAPIVCTDTQSDPKNCGGCGMACPSSAPCVNGTCGMVQCAKTGDQCDVDSDCCSGTCVNAHSGVGACG